MFNLTALIKLINTNNDGTIQQVGRLQSTEYLEMVDKSQSYVFKLSIFVISCDSDSIGI